jgi:hypothetical protein
MDLYGCVWFYIDLLWFVWSYIEFILCIYIKCQNKCVLNLCTLCIYINIYVFIYIYTYIYKYVYVYIYIYIRMFHNMQGRASTHFVFPTCMRTQIRPLGWPEGQRGEPSQTFPCCKTGRKVKEVSHLRPSHVAKHHKR